MEHNPFLAHIVYYSKGWYGRTKSTADDVGKIMMDISWTWGFPPRKADILSMVSRIFFATMGKMDLSHFESGRDPMHEVWKDCFTSYYANNDGTVHIDKIIAEMIGEIGIRNVENFGTLFEDVKQDYKYREIITGIPHADENLVQFAMD